MEFILYTENINTYMHTYKMYDNTTKAGRKEMELYFVRV